MLENFDPASIADEGLRAIVLLLMTEVERLSADNQALTNHETRKGRDNRKLRGGSKQVVPQWSVRRQSSGRASTPSTRSTAVYQGARYTQ